MPPSDTEKIIDSALANAPPAKNGKKVKQTAKNSETATKKNKNVKEAAPAQVGASGGPFSTKCTQNKLKLCRKEAREAVPRILFISPIEDSRDGIVCDAVAVEDHEG